MDKFWFIMIFYALLSSIVAPYIGYHLKGNAGLGQGYVAGSVLSLILWFTVGKKYAAV